MKNVIPITLFTFNRLNMKAPPADIFEELLGYSGEQRFVGFCYTGHALSIEDGQINEVGDRRPWSAWYRSLGAEVLRYYCFGYEGRSPEHLLILDRKSRALFAGPVQATQEALKQQIPRLQVTAAEPTSRASRETKAEDLTGMLANTMSAPDCELHQAKKKEGMDKLTKWLGNKPA